MEYFIKFNEYNFIKVKFYTIFNRYTEIEIILNKDMHIDIKFKNLKRFITNFVTVDNKLNKYDLYVYPYQGKLHLKDKTIYEYTEVK